MCVSQVSAKALSPHVSDIWKILYETQPILYGLYAPNEQQPYNAGSRNFKKNVKLIDV